MKALLLGIAAFAVGSIVTTLILTTIRLFFGIDQIVLASFFGLMRSSFIAPLGEELSRFLFARRLIPTANRLTGIYFGVAFAVSEEILHLFLRTNFLESSVADYYTISQAVGNFGSRLLHVTCAVIMLCGRWKAVTALVIALCLHSAHNFVNNVVVYNVGYSYAEHTFKIVVYVSVIAYLTRHFSCGAFRQEGRESLNSSS